MGPNEDRIHKLRIDSLRAQIFATQCYCETLALELEGAQTDGQRARAEKEQDRARTQLKALERLMEMVVRHGPESGALTEGESDA